jgi:hypothetical protein
MITEELIEGLDLPDYESWSEGIWCDDFWWDWIVEQAIEDWSAKGITIVSHRNSRQLSITFDLYQRQCASDGGVYFTEIEQFYKAYEAQLTAVSAVYAQMLRECMISIGWSSTRNGWLTVTVEPDDYIDDDFTFKDGLFAGTSVRALMESETVRFESFIDCVTDIIKDLHQELLNDLTSAYEYDTSQEAYKEWILNEIKDAVYTNQTVLNKTTTQGE